MKPRQYETTLALSIAGGGETELDLTITYTVSPGSPETGRGYMADPAKYDPGSSDELNIESFTLSRCDVISLDWLMWQFHSDDTLREAILADWRETEASDREAVMEDRAERAAEDRRERAMERDRP